MTWDIRRECKPKQPFASSKPALINMGLDMGDLKGYSAYDVEL